VAHCPDSNAFLGSGSLPIDRALAHGLPLALGSDVAAGRSFRIPRAAGAAFDNALRHGVRLEPARLLWWATRGAALALGQDDVGALRPGMAADMVLHAVPDEVEDEAQALAAILFDVDAVRVSRTWVRGAVIWSGQPR
jgi:guanine deaminase